MYKTLVDEDENFLGYDPSELVNSHFIDRIDYTHVFVRVYIYVYIRVFICAYISAVQNWICM